MHNIVKLRGTQSIAYIAMHLPNRTISEVHRYLDENNYLSKLEKKQEKKGCWLESEEKRLIRLFTKYGKYLDGIYPFFPKKSK